MANPQDYHCSPAVADRAQLMVHVFYYFNGLNGTVGDLMCVPGSQKAYIRGIPPSFNNPQDHAQWGDAGGPADLPQQQVFDDLPKGTAIIVHRCERGDTVFCFLNSSQFPAQAAVKREHLPRQAQDKTQGGN